MRFVSIPRKSLDDGWRARVAALVCSSFDTVLSPIQWDKIHSVVGLELDERLVSVVLVTWCSSAFGARFAFEKVCTSERQRGNGHASAVLRFAAQRFSPAILHVNRQPGHDQLVAWFEKMGFVAISTNMTETALMYQYLQT